VVRVELVHACIVKLGGKLGHLGPRGGHC
jgi:hypothetical protein